MRRTLTLALVAGALAIPSRAVEAQAPIKIYCNSPAQIYCAAFIEYFVDFIVPPEQNPQQARWTGTVQLYGSGYAAVNMPVTLLGATLCNFGLIASFTTDGPGEYTFGDASGGGQCPEGYGFDPGPDELALLSFVPGENCSPREGTCVQVPEPASGILMAAGLFGLAFVRRRRGRDDLEI